MKHISIGKIFYNNISAIITCYVLAVTITGSFPETLPHEGFVKDFVNTMLAVLGELDSIWLLLFFLISFYYKKIARTITFSRHVMVISSILSAFLVIGISFEKSSSLKFIYSNSFFVVHTIVSIYSFMSLIYSLIIAAYYSLDIMNSEQVKSKFTVFEKHPIIITCVLLTVGWFPYLMAFWPGSLPHDAATQLNVYYGGTLSNMQPIFSTYVIGFFADLGKIFGSNALGIFFYIIFQTLCFELVVVYMLSFMRNINVRTDIQLMSVIYFAFLPIWGASVQAVVKDTLFFVVTLLWIIQFSVCLIDQTKFSKISHLLGLFVSSILVCLFRNNGVYVVLPTLVVMLCLKMQRSTKIKLIITCICVLGFYLVHTKIVLPAVVVEDKVATREMLSVPFQQTARYIVENGEKVTQEEREAIDKILTYEAIADVYNPNISDYVKNMYKHNVSKDDLKNYFKVWFQMLCKDPLCYVEATLHNTYGYYYPGQQMKIQSVYQYYIKEELNYYCEYNYIPGLQKYRDVIIAWSYVFINLPVLGMLMNPGFYTWFTIICLGYIIRKKKYALFVVMMPSIMTILVCLASPVNGLERYMLPVMVGAPVIFALLTKVDICIDGNTRNLRENINCQMEDI